MKTANSSRQFEKMTEDSIPSLVTKMALPTVASMLVTSIYNMADTYFVSQISTSAAAAVGVNFSLMSIIQAVGFSVGMGASSFISRTLGAKEDDKASMYGSSAFFLSVSFGLLLMIFGLSFLHGLMKVLGATDTILPYAADYGKYILISAPIMCASFVLNNILKSQGKAVFSMVGLCLGSLLNIVLDPIFIFTMGMGIKGAALATMLGQIISFGTLGFFFVSKKSIVVLSLKRLSRHFKDYIDIITTGAPTLFRQGLASIATALINVQAAAFGDAAIAAISIATRIYLMVRNIVLGIGQGFQPVAGYNYGAGKYSRVKEAFIFATKAGTVICLIATVFVGFNAEFLMELFRKGDPEVIAIGTRALYFFCMSMPLLAYSTYVNQMYQCLGFRTVATILACCRQGIFFIPIVLILPALTGVTGIELTQPLADVLTFIVSIPFQLSFFKGRLKEENIKMVS